MFRELTMVIFALFLAAAAHAEPRSFDDGVYTKAQAEGGEELFEEHCGTCHEPEYFQDVFRAWSGGGE